MTSPRFNRAGGLSASSAEPLWRLPSPPIGYEEACVRYLPELERRLGERRISSGLVLEMIDYHLQTGGKRMRAVLPVWVCENFGGNPEAALELGVGLELLHNATLVHDDLQDGDTHRRGRPTVWSRWGMAQAINAGDALIFEAFTRIACSPVAPRVLAAISTAAVHVVEGQSLDLRFQHSAKAGWRETPSLETWMEMARGKTGELFALCMRAGAAAAGVSDAVCESAARYGDDVGLLFQIQDDLLDLVGDKGRERRGADLMEGKLSFPVLTALKSASPDSVAPIRDILARSRDERTWPMVDEALDALSRCGALEATASYLSSAGAAAEAHPLADVVPGLVSWCLAPVRHALDRTGSSTDARSAP